MNYKGFSFVWEKTIFRITSFALRSMGLFGPFASGKQRGFFKVEMSD